MYLLVRRKSNPSVNIFTEDLYVIKLILCTQNLLVSI